MTIACPVIVVAVVVVVAMTVIWVDFAREFAVLQNPHAPSLHAPLASHERLATALRNSQPGIGVTIMTNQHIDSEAGRQWHRC